MSGEIQPPIDTRSETSTSGFSGLLASVINAGPGYFGTSPTGHCTSAL
jgi:hypothetical protein